MIDYEKLEKRFNDEIDKAETIEDIKPILKILARIVMGIVRQRHLWRRGVD